jgi:hypothetical protein
MYIFIEVTEIIIFHCLYNNGDAQYIYSEIHADKSGSLCVCLNWRIVISD